MNRLSLFFLFFYLSLIAGDLGVSVGFTGGVEMMMISERDGGNPRTENFTAIGGFVEYSLFRSPSYLRSGFEHTWKTKEFSGKDYKYTDMQVYLGLGYMFFRDAPVNLYAGLAGQFHNAQFHNAIGHCTDNYALEILAFYGLSFNLGIVSIFAESSLGWNLKPDFEWFPPVPDSYQFSFQRFQHIPIRGGIKINL